jgi:lipoate-protein ligase A
MARDEELFNRVISEKIPGAVRFYNWDEPAVTTGYHQKEFRFADRDTQIPVLKRPTGGGSVLHSNDITFSISAPCIGLFKGDIQSTYRAVSEIFLQALKTCGVSAGIHATDGSFSSVCFERAARLELIYQGRKIMGAAQVRKKGFFLLQGVIPLTVDERLYRMIFGEGVKMPAGILDMVPEFSEQLFIMAVKNLMCEKLGIEFLNDAQA